MYYNIYREGVNRYIYVTVYILFYIYWFLECIYTDLPPHLPPPVATPLILNCRGIRNFRWWLTVKIYNKLWTWQSDQLIIRLSLWGEFWQKPQGRLTAVAAAALFDRFLWRKSSSVAFYWWFGENSAWKTVTGRLQMESAHVVPRRINFSRIWEPLIWFSAIEVVTVYVFRVFPVVSIQCIHRSQRQSPALFLNQDH